MKTDSIFTNMCIFWLCFDRGVSFCKQFRNYANWVWCLDNCHYILKKRKKKTVTYFDFTSARVLILTSENISGQRVLKH